VLRCTRNPACPKFGWKARLSKKTARPVGAEGVLIPNRGFDSSLQNGENSRWPGVVRNKRRRGLSHQGSARGKDTFTGGAKKRRRTWEINSMNSGGGSKRKEAFQNERKLKQLPRETRREMKKVGRGEAKRGEGRKGVVSTWPEDLSKRGRGKRGSSRTS